MGNAQPVATPAALRYRERRTRFISEAERLAGRSGRLANLRLLAFVAAVGFGTWALWTGFSPIWLGGLAALAAFVALVVRHRRVERDRERTAGLARLSREGEQRVARDWASLPVRHEVAVEPGHPYAADLDLVGRASLFQLLDTVGTWMGERTLSRWLLAPADPATIRERQAAVAELAPLLDLRDELTRRARGDGEARPDPTPFLAWAEGEPWLRRRPGLLWAARIGPPLLVALATAARAVHLTESVSDNGDGPRMTFDYRLRPGIARSTNALRLMELVGIPLGQPTAEP